MEGTAEGKRGTVCDGDGPSRGGNLQKLADAGLKRPHSRNGEKGD